MSGFLKYCVLRRKICSSWEWMCITNYHTFLKNIIKVSNGIFFSSFLFQNKVIFQSPSSFCLALTVQSFAIRLMGRLTVKVHLEGKCEIPSPFLKFKKMGSNTFSIGTFIFMHLHLHIHFHQLLINT